MTDNAQPSGPPAPGPRLLRSAVAVGGMTILSRILGLVRDIVFARFFGASLVMDAFFVAFKIPNIFRRFFAEGPFPRRSCRCSPNTMKGAIARKCRN